MWGEGEAVKAGDVFITFIFVLRRWRKAVRFLLHSQCFPFRESFFYDCSELKCFYVRWRMKEWAKRERRKKTGNVLLRILFRRKSFYLNNIFFWHSLHQYNALLKRLRTVDEGREGKMKTWKQQKHFMFK